jgi:LysM repeat protein
MHSSAFLSAALALWLLGSCGQVITRITPTPQATPTLVIAITQEATLRPTATPAPYTPAPTATPTITPTPVIYQVRSGDSLLAIASNYHVTVRSLTDANGITDPGSLQVGQELVIPQEAPAAEGEGTPTVQPTPLPFTIENVSFSRTPLGGLWCFGEIHNTAGMDLEQAGVVITLLDAGGKPLAQAETNALLDLIGVDGRAPFVVRFDQPPAAGFASYTVLPKTGVRGYLGSYYRDLAARNLKGEGERYAAYTVSGDIANTGPEDAVEVTVTVTLYDALGRVIGVRQGVPEHNVILRGGETSFRLELTPAGGPVDHFRVDALGRRLPTPTPPAA